MNAKKAKALRRASRNPLLKQTIRTYQDGTKYEVPVGLKTQNYIYRALKDGYKRGQVDL